jgi:hypothetical protein
MYPSGAWYGYWEQVYWGRQFMEPLQLRFAAGRITGEGRDIIGPFTFQGTYDEQGAVTLFKQYVGRHCVLYQGRYDGEGTISGTWTIGTVWSGPFALRPAEFKVPADAPIIAVTADPGRARRGPAPAPVEKEDAVPFTLPAE